MSSQVPDEFDRNVFINCPFDPAYLSLLRSLLFTIVYFRFVPKIALESSDSGEMRINKICELIKSSRYSIHDLSRLQSSKRKEFYRMNMPFELGIEYGCRHFASDHLGEKRCLILAKERHDYYEGHIRPFWCRYQKPRERGTRADSRRKKLVHRDSWPKRS